MTTNPKTTEQAANPSDGTTPNVPGTPTVTYYQQLSESLMSDIDKIANAIPGLEARHAATGKFVRGHLSIPNGFIASAFAAVDQIASLQGTQKFDVDAARDALQFLDAFKPMLDKLTAIRDALEYTLWSKKSSFAADALQIYAVSKGLARDPGSAQGAVTMSSHVETMKRDLGQRGRKRKRKSNSPDSTDTPAPTTGGNGTEPRQ
jgi:hypothetical protein